MKNHGFAVAASCLVHALAILAAVTVSRWQPERSARVDLTLLPELLTPAAADSPATPAVFPASTVPNEPAPAALPPGSPASAPPPPAPVSIARPTPPPATPVAETNVRTSPAIVQAAVPAVTVSAAPPASVQPPVDEQAEFVPDSVSRVSTPAGTPTDTVSRQPQTAAPPAAASLPASPPPTGGLLPRETVNAIMEHLRTGVQYPERARRNGWEGKVTVSFRLGPDGAARDVAVVDSSGFPLLDRSALSAVRRASPFPYRPPRETELRLPVVYALR